MKNHTLYPPELPDDVTPGVRLVRFDAPRDEVREAASRIAAIMARIDAVMPQAEEEARAEAERMGAHPDGSYACDTILLRAQALAGVDIPLADLVRYGGVIADRFAKSEARLSMPKSIVVHDVPIDPERVKEFRADFAKRISGGPGRIITGARRMVIGGVEVAGEPSPFRGGEKREGGE